MLAGEWKGIVAAIGLSVRHLRRLLGWSQAELAQRAVVSQGCISRIESGHYPDLPFHSVVVTLRALEQGAHAANLSIVPPTRGLLDFCAGLDPAYHLTRTDPDLGRLVRCYHTLTPPQQRALVTFLTSMTGAQEGNQRTRKVGSHGKEVHPKGDQEAGPTAPRPRRPAGQEDPSLEGLRRSLEGRQDWSACAFCPDA